MSIKSNIKRIIGKENLKKIRPLYHGFKSYWSAFRLGFPSKKLKLIGINATKGKTSTTIMTGRLMNLMGLKTGYITTAIINTRGNKEGELLNKYKMTTLGGDIMQTLLKEMVDNGCNYVVLEMSSQGLEQNRHWGLGKFWMTVFMNLYPEHIEAHGSLEKYIQAKQKLFSSLGDDGVFVGNTSVEQIGYTQKMKAVITAKNFQKISLKQSEHFEIEVMENGGKKLKLDGGKEVVFGQETANFELENMAFSHKIASLCLPQEKQIEVADFLPRILGLPGRMEFVVKHNQVVFNSQIKIAEGKNTDENVDSRLSKNFEYNSSDISILVDYAHEPESLKQMLNTLRDWKKAGLYTQIIHILSVDGAGRDDWKKPIMGDLSLKLADFTILTTDNYDQNDDPEQIIDLMSQNYPVISLATQNTKLSTTYPQLIHNLSTDTQDLSTTYPQGFAKTIKRRVAMQLALDVAVRVFEESEKQNMKEKILIVSTGVGTEQGLTQPEGVIDWDERKVWLDLWQII